MFRASKRQKREKKREDKMQVKRIKKMKNSEGGLKDRVQEDFRERERK